MTDYNGEELMAELLCEQAILKAQILGLCDLLLRKRVIDAQELGAFLDRYSLKRQPQVTPEFLKGRLKQAGLSESEIEEIADLAERHRRVAARTRRADQE